MKSTFRSAPALLCLFLSLCGCHRGNPGLIGEWKYRLPDVQFSSGDSPLKQATGRNGLEMMKDFGLVLRADHTFTLRVMAPMTGTWSADPAAVTLHIETVEAAYGAPKQAWKKNVVAALSQDGHQLRIDQGALMPMPFTFEKP